MLIDRDFGACSDGEPDGDQSGKPHLDERLAVSWRRLEARQESEAFGSELLQAVVINAERFDGRVIVPEDLSALGVKDRPDRAAVVEIDADAHEIVELIGKENRARIEGRGGERFEMVTLAVDPGARPAGIVLLGLRTMDDQFRDARAELGLNPRGRDFRVLDRIMQQACDDHVFRKPLAVEDHRDRHNVLEVRHAGNASLLAMVPKGGTPQRPFESFREHGMT